MTFSTETSVDRNAAKKALEQEIAALVRQRDLAKIETMQYVAARDSVVGELKAKGALNDTVIGIHSTVMNVLADQRGEALRKVEGIEGDHKRLSTEVPTLEAQKQALIAEIVRLGTEVTHHKKERENTVSDLNNAKSAKQQEIDRLDKDILAKQGELTTATDDLKIAREEYAQKNAWILSEEVRLGNKGRDLAIYEARIREEAAKLDPPMAITL